MLAQPMLGICVNDVIGQGASVLDLDFPQAGGSVMGAENAAGGIHADQVDGERVALAEFANLSEREIMLGYWAKVHGIATILATQKNFIPRSELDAAIDRVVRTAF